MVTELLVPNVTHLHQNQVFLLTMHSTDSHTDMYIQTIFIRPRVCVYIYLHIFKHQYEIQVSTYRNSLGIPVQQKTKHWILFSYNGMMHTVSSSFIKDRWIFSCCGSTLKAMSYVVVIKRMCTFILKRRHIYFLDMKNVIVIQNQ